VRSSRTRRPSSPSRISSGDYTTFKYLSATIERPRRPHKPNWPLQKAVGVSNGRRLTGKLPILPPGAVVHRRSVVKAWYLMEFSTNFFRCKALTEQNNVLHQHLDNVSSQAARIRQAADSSAGTPSEGETADGTESKLSELRAVINYLRKEKEIVEMQLELCKQENARLKTQMGHLTRDLEDTRATLSDVSLPCFNRCVISLYHSL
jgi:hypothetical protein